MLAPADHRATYATLRTATRQEHRHSAGDPGGTQPARRNPFPSPPTLLGARIGALDAALDNHRGSVNPPKTAVESP